MENPKGKFRWFGWLNPGDVLIAGAIVALVWGAALFSAPKEAAAKPGDVTVRYTVELKQKEAGFHKKIPIGAALYDNQKGYYIGTIVAVYPEPYREETPDESAGIIRRAVVDGQEFVYLVVEANAQVSDLATSIGQYDIMVNKEVLAKSKTFAGRGFITAIEYLTETEG